MANSLREVKTRIQSTESTQQITKAMHMVSQSKVKKAEKSYKNYKDFMERISSMVSEIVEKAGTESTNPLLKKREVKKTAYLIVTSDRGLCGSYNSTVFKKLTEVIESSHTSKDEFVTQAIGKQGFSYLKRMNYPLLTDSQTLVRDDVMFVDIAPLAKAFIDAYLNGEIDKLVIIYNHYENSLTQEITVREILPIDKIEKEKSSGIDYVYETGIERTLSLVLPMYVQDVIYGIILDAKTAEHSARMNSMKSATDNAKEVIDKLQLLYNRARQNVVTNELIDIIGGANAIGGDK